MQDTQLADVIDTLTGLLARLSPPPPAPEPPRNWMAEFLAGEVQHIDGGVIPVSELYGEFTRWLPPSERLKWTKRRVEEAMSPLRVVDAAYRGRRTRVVAGVLWRGQTLPAPPAPEPEAEPPAPARSPLETFIAEQCHEVPGSMIKFSDFFERFKLWMEEEEIEGRGDWTSRMKVIKALPHSVPYGVRYANQRYVGNISWENEKSDAKPLTVKNGKLKVAT